MARAVNTAARTPVAAPLPDTTHLRLAWATIGFTMVLALVAFLVVAPIAILLVQSFEVGAFGQATTWGIENWRNAFTDARLTGALWNTVTLAFTRQAIAIVFGVLLAWVIARTDLPGRQWLEFGFWVAVFLPTLTVVLGWIMVFDSFNGLANKLVEMLPFVQRGPFDIFSWWGIVWVHLVTGTLPVKIMLLTPAFRNMDSTLEEASHASGASTMGTIFRVITPLMAPTILVATVLGLIRSLEAFEIELVLGYPAGIEVYSTLIYRLAHRSPPEYGQATILGLVILASVMPLIGFQQWFTGRRSYQTISGKYKTQPHKLGRWRWPMFAVIATLVLIMTVLPVGLVIAGTFMSIFGYFGVSDAWTLRNWQTVMSSPNFTNALINSALIAGGTAIFAMAVFSLIAYIVVRTQFYGRKALDMLVWLPSTLPGVVIGLGYLWLFLGTPFLRPLYGTTWILILVAALGSITLTTQIVKGALLQLGAELEEASWASGASWWHTFRHVTLPLIAPALAVVGVLAFSAAARATSHVALLSTYANQPLSMLQLNLMSDNNFEAASVVGVFILLMTVGVAFVARILGLRVGPHAG